MKTAALNAIAGSTGSISFPAASVNASEETERCEVNLDIARPGSALMSRRSSEENVISSTKL